MSLRSAHCYVTHLLTLNHSDAAGCVNFGRPHQLSTFQMLQRQTTPNHCSVAKCCNVATTKQVTFDLLGCCDVARHVCQQHDTFAMLLGFTTAHNLGNHPSTRTTRHDNFHIEQEVIDAAQGPRDGEQFIAQLRQYVSDEMHMKNTARRCQRKHDFGAFFRISVQRDTGGHQNSSLRLVTTFHH